MDSDFAVFITCIVPIRLTCGDKLYGEILVQLPQDNRIFPGAENLIQKKRVHRNFYSVNNRIECQISTLKKVVPWFKNDTWKLFLVWYLQWLTARCVMHLPSRPSHKVVIMCHPGISVTWKKWWKGMYAYKIWSLDCLY